MAKKDAIISLVCKVLSVAILALAAILSAKEYTHEALWAFALGIYLIEKADHYALKYQIDAEAAEKALIAELKKMQK